MKPSSIFRLSSNSERLSFRRTRATRDPYYIPSRWDRHSLFHINSNLQLKRFCFSTGSNKTTEEQVMNRIKSALTNFMRSSPLRGEDGRIAPAP